MNRPAVSACGQTGQLSRHRRMTESDPERTLGSSRTVVASGARGQTASTPIADLLASYPATIAAVNSVGSATDRNCRRPRITSANIRHSQHSASSMSAMIRRSRAVTATIGWWLQIGIECSFVGEPHMIAEELQVVVRRDQHLHALLDPSRLGRRMEQAAQPGGWSSQDRAPRRLPTISSLGIALRPTPQPPLSRSDLVLWHNCCQEQKRRHVRRLAHNVSAKEPHAAYLGSS